MLVWRVENKEGLGPYMAGWCIHYQSMYLYCSLKHPNPPGHVQSSKYLFGFRNKKELKSWFPKKVRVDMRKAGYNVVCCIVPNSSIVNCDRHIAFLKATKGKSIRISKF